MSKTIVNDEKVVPAVPEVMTIKNFRSNGDIENFYRYIHDNGLRREAFMLMEYAISKVAKVRKGKRSKTLQ
ncbi:MAG TPA: hypothetical protein VNJ01_16225 [Bacteriovoracaceae bacterium]|nr:hypothetical protein [Bacteriovoracaceae bacterium]